MTDPISELVDGALSDTTKELKITNKITSTILASLVPLTMTSQQQFTIFSHKTCWAHILLLLTMATTKDFSKNIYVALPGYRVCEPCTSMIYRVQSEN